MGVVNFRFEGQTLPIEAVSTYEEIANRLVLVLENAVAARSTTITDEADDLSGRNLELDLPQGAQAAKRFVTPCSSRKPIIEFPVKKEFRGSGIKRFLDCKFLNSQIDLFSLHPFPGQSD